MVDIRDFFGKANKVAKKASASTNIKSITNIKKKRREPDTPSTVASAEDDTQETKKVKEKKEQQPTKVAYSKKAPSSSSSSSTATSTTNATTKKRRKPTKYSVGTEVKKLFPGSGVFRGKVTDILEDCDKEGTTLYKVTYSDGDQEDCTESELEEILLTKKQEVASPVRTSPRANKKPRRQYKEESIESDDVDEEEESEEFELDEEEESGDDESEEEEEIPTWSRRKSSTKKPSTRRTILDDSSDEEMEVDRKPAALKDDMMEEEEEVLEQDQDEPPAAKKPKTTNVSSSKAKASPASFFTAKKSKSTTSAISSKPKASPVASKKDVTTNSKPQPAAKKPIPTPKPSAPSAWGSLVFDRGQYNKKKKSSTGGQFVKEAYCKGDDLPVITEPAKMFDDMISVKLTHNGTRASILLPLLKKLHGRPLRVATMCSGTESPILALDMLSKSIEDFYHSHKNEFDGIVIKDNEPLLQIEHVFSCEIEPFKQAYIERNFHPPLLFRDIRELGNDKAHTAYGSLVDVPCHPEDVDMLVAGTSCVDYSNLNNEKKTIKQGGESGQTWRGMIDYIKKAEPPIVILENVKGAPWDTKVKIFEDLGYHAAWISVDTKDYYIPHTRQRGYLFAVKKASTIEGASPIPRKVAANWKRMVKDLERPASGALDAFMLANDDPRVLRGRARLSGSDPTDTGTDWVKCQSRHQYARASEELGEKHPLTGAHAGSTTMPPFAWNEWTNSQVQRVHDLLDISTLRCAKEGVDCTTKAMIWNLSQNVDRDTIGRLGLSQCLTPSGVPYVTNRGGPLVGEEVLLLQGIPAEDLLLTRETEKNLKDLAGNAMSSTVVGACMLSALLLGGSALGTRSSEAASTSGMIVPSLVPRPLALSTGEITSTREMAKYSKNPLPLGPLLDPTVDQYQDVLEAATLSARMCVTEGMDEAKPFSSLLQCKLCGFTCSEECATPLPSKYEEHDLVCIDLPDDSRLHPPAFRAKILRLLPMKVMVHKFNVNLLEKPEGISDTLWSGWKSAIVASTTKSVSNGESQEYRYTNLTRSHVWTALYTSSNCSSRLKLQLSEKGAVWFLFAPAPAKKGKLREVLEKPIARMHLHPTSRESVFTSGEWEVCLPTSTNVELKIEGVGAQIPSWRSRLGLKGIYENEVQFDKLKVTVETNDCDDLKSKIDGEYDSLPKCGAACGSLHKRRSDSSDEKSADFGDIYFFLDSGRHTLNDNDSFVFSLDKERLSYGQQRDVLVKIDTKAKYRTEFQSEQASKHQTLRVQATAPGSWIKLAKASIHAVPDETDEEKRSTMMVPIESPLVSLSSDGWKACPTLLEAVVPFSSPNDWLPAECNKLLSRSTKSSVIEVNLQKSASVFRSLAFATSRLDAPNVVQSWLPIDTNTMKREADGEEIPCEVCAPSRPPIKWQLIQKGKSILAVPIEDGKLQARFEHSMKHRPNPWLVTLEMASETMVRVKIAANPVSLANRALGLFPSTLARRTLVDRAVRSDQEASSDSKTIFEWRVVPHDENKSSAPFPKLTFTSNKGTTPANQPPGFKSGRYPLRPEQLRSLAWMLEQEATDTPFFEEEVEESILPSLNWRVEARAKRPVLVRGGIVADEVGYGKTAITLGLIDAAPKVNGEPPPVPEEYKRAFFHTKATLVIVPTHLTGQWPREVAKFLGDSKKVITIKDMSSFNKLTVAEVLEADMVIVNFNVLSGEKYFSRLARFAGVDTGSLPRGDKGGRHFDAVYRECLNGLGRRIATHRNDCSGAFDEIEKDARRHESLANEDGYVRLDGKKSVYKSVSEEQAKAAGSTSTKSKASTKSKSSAADIDPWGLQTSEVKKDMEEMKCPPLELFWWDRVVVDEFTYLRDKADRARVESVALGLKSSFRWALSATPAHENFNDMKSLASLLGIHLGVDEALPGPFSKKKKAKGDQEMSASEKFSSLLETRSMQWHEHRHLIGQSFLDRFVRQNIAEIDEIKFEEHVIPLDLPAAERGIYLEMENYLKSVEMDFKKALKSRKDSTSDRENRMQTILKDSSFAEEALLKRCAHFSDLSSKSTATALETCDLIIDQRKLELTECESELVGMIAAALRQRERVLKKDRGWKGMTRSEKGDVEDSLERYILDVRNRGSIQGGADGEVHQRLRDLLRLAEAEAKKNPEKEDPVFAKANDVFEDGDGDQTEGKNKKKRDRKDESLLLYGMKLALRDHMHKVRGLGKELRGRMQSLRYFTSVREFQLETTEHECMGHASSFCDCQESGGKIPRDRLGVLSSCGHVGCLSCLNHHADLESCIDPSCDVPVKRTHIASAVGLGAERGNTAGGKYGMKLTTIVGNVKKLVGGGDRVIVFTQFDDLKEKISEALLDSGIKSLQVTGTVQQQVKVLDILQKEVPAKDDPRVLLLTMDNESSAGVNLTTCNHAIFVHPLVADSQQQYDAYETQAIGRIRRYGQTKTVHIWRYLARDTIDTEIFVERGGKLPKPS